MRDTTPEATRVARDAIRRTDPVERTCRALEYSETVRALALTPLRARYLELPTIALVEMLLGERLIRDDDRTWERDRP